MLSITNTGILFSFQDFGRLGKKKYGISNSGCLDKYSFMLSNLLCNNKKMKHQLKLFQEDLRGFSYKKSQLQLRGQKVFLL